MLCQLLNKTTHTQFVRYLWQCFVEFFIVVHSSGMPQKSKCVPVITFSFNKYLCDNRCTYHTCWEREIHPPTGTYFAVINVTLSGSDLTGGVPIITGDVSMYLITSRPPSCQGRYRKASCDPSQWDLLGCTKRHSQQAYELPHTQPRSRLLVHANKAPFTSNA